MHLSSQTRGNIFYYGAEQGKRLLPLSPAPQIPAEAPPLRLRKNHRPTSILLDEAEHFLDIITSASLRSDIIHIARTLHSLSPEYAISVY